jgi:hypothetical protein
MPFTSGQRLTAAMLNRITRGDLEALVTSDMTITTTETDVPGASISVTTIQANTVLKITASFDVECTGTSDFPFVLLYVDGSAQADNMKFQRTGRGTISKTWLVTRGSAGTFTVKLTADKVGVANTIIIYQTHSNLIVSGNGIS